MTDGGKQTGFSLLTAWANGQDHWIRALVAEVIETQRPIVEGRVDVYYEAMLREKELAAGTPLKVAEVEASPGSVLGEEGLVLESMSNVENVNALTSGQTILFNSRLTVLFGENGAGKTGYVRVLKTVGAVRTAEVILPDVTTGKDATEAPPSASLRYRLGSAGPKDVAWTGERGIAPLTRMDVFDAASVDIHVDGSLEFVYTPSEIAVFGYAHEGIKAVKDRLEKAAKGKKPRGNPFLERFSRDGKFHNAMETLGAATDLGPLEKSGVLSADEEAEKPKLEQQVEALRPGASDAKLEVARSEKTLFESVDNALRVGREFDASDYTTKLKTLEDATQAEREWTVDLLQDVPIPGVGGETWRKFVEAGDAYIKAEVGDEYPKDDDKCIYCMQPLQASALELLTKHKQFARGEKKAAVAAAKLALSDVGKELKALALEGLVRDLETKLGSLADERKSALEACLRPIRFLVDLQQDITAGRSASEQNVADELRDVSSAVEQRVQQATELTTALEGQVKERKTFLTEAEAKLRDLKDRMALKELLPAIRERVSDAKWSSVALTICSRLTQVVRALTEQSKTASAKLLNQDFQSMFSNECKALRAPKVTLKFPGKDGHPARMKSLAANAGLRKILSEGEQKVVALADFLAEAELRKSSAPIVFDDPVTSLDYLRVDYVVKRILALSQERQVVVFTHNIMFTMKLLHCFEKNRNECSYYDVRDEDGKRGLIYPGLSPQIDTWANRKARVDDRIKWAREETNPEKRLAWIASGYDSLRGACEIVVEQDMLQRVVQSYRQNVMVGKLRDLNIDALRDEIGPLNELFDKCCDIVEAHRHPDETWNTKPKLEDLEEDWERLKKLRKRFS